MPDVLDIPHSGAATRGEDPCPGGLRLHSTDGGGEVQDEDEVRINRTWPVHPPRPGATAGLPGGRAPRRVAPPHQLEIKGSVLWAMESELGSARSRRPRRSSTCSAKAVHRKGQSVPPLDCEGSGRIFNEAVWTAWIPPATLRLTAYNKRGTKGGRLELLMNAGSLSAGGWGWRHGERQKNADRPHELHGSAGAFPAEGPHHLQQARGRHLPRRRGAHYFRSRASLNYLRNFSGARSLRRVSKFKLKQWIYKRRYARSTCCTAPPPSHEASNVEVC